MRGRRWGILIFLGLALGAGAQTPPAAEPAPTNGLPVRLMLTWSAQAQFAGFYMARAKGFYSKRGLDVTLVSGGPGRDPLQFLKEGRTDVTSLWLANAIIAREQGVPLRLLGQVFNRSSLAIAAWKDRGIRKPADLAGRKIALWESFRPPFAAFFKQLNIRPEIHIQHGNLSLFMRRGVDACAIMYYNEFNALYLSGIDPEELVVFFLRDYGIDFPEDGLYAREEFVRSHPAAAAALIAATLEGWRYAADHPEEALDLVLAEARAEHVPTNRAHMRWMLEQCRHAVFPDAGGQWTPGRLTPESHARTGALLREQGLARAVPAFADFIAPEAPHAP